MILQMHAFKAAVDQIDPRLWSLLIALIVGGLVFSVKKWTPNIWDAIPSRFKALPPTIIAALLSSTTGQSATQVIIDALFGAFSGLTAAGGHELLARLSSKPEAQTENGMRLDPGMQSEPDPGSNAGGDHAEGMQDGASRGLVSDAKKDES